MYLSKGFEHLDFTFVAFSLEPYYFYSTTLKDNKIYTSLYFYISSKVKKQQGSPALFTTCTTFTLLMFQRLFCSATGRAHNL